jgi:hypothetical protein
MSYKKEAGKRFGRILVLERAEDTLGKAIQYKCRCDCGREKIVRQDQLRAPATQKCECRIRPKSTKPRKEPETRWLTVDGRTDLLSYWAKRYRVEYNVLCHRIDSGWPVEEALNISVSSNINSRQAMKKSEKTKVTHQGATKTLLEWSEITGIPWETIHDRLQRKWTVEDTLTLTAKPRADRFYRPRVSKHAVVIYNGDAKTLLEWSASTGINWKTIYDRLDRGWKVEKAIATPVVPKNI